MEEGVAMQEKQDNTNNCAYYNLTYLKRNFPTKAEVSYNLRHSSDTQKTSVFISFFKYLYKHINLSSYLNADFQQVDFWDNYRTFKDYLGNIILVLTIEKKLLLMERLS